MPVEADLATDTASKAFGNLADEVLRLSGRIATATDRLASITGLTGAQHLVLTAVVNAAHPPTVSQIGRSLGHSRQAVQRIADHLATRGLVSFESNPDHKVARLLVVTESGRTAHATVHELSQDWISATVDGVATDDIEAATSTVRALRTRIEHPERSQ